METLRGCFETLGFNRSELKTLSFRIDTKYDSYRDHKNDYKQRFQGYEYHHNMKIEFDADNVLLGKVLFKLSKCSVKPEFNIQYTIKNPEEAKNELLTKAVTDSLRKAEILTKAAGKQLGDILNIDYSWGEIEFVSHSSNRMLQNNICLNEEVSSYEIDIEPEDIDVSDTVTIVWEIK